MKNLLFCVLAFLLVVNSCNKKYDFDKKDGYCSLNDATEINSSEFQDPFNFSADLTQYILKDLIVDPNTGCITSGWVKYLRNGMTVALVDYGYGENGDWMVITNCVNGNCEDSGSTCTKIQQSCDTSSSDH